MKTSPRGMRGTPVPRAQWRHVEQYGTNAHWRSTLTQKLLENFAISELPDSRSPHLLACCTLVNNNRSARIGYSNNVTPTSRAITCATHACA